jgi:hypothetical protein
MDHRLSETPVPNPRWQLNQTAILETTPKAFANSSPGLEHSDNPGIC